MGILYENQPGVINKKRKMYLSRFLFITYPASGLRYIGRFCGVV